MQSVNIAYHKEIFNSHAMQHFCLIVCNALILLEESKWSHRNRNIHKTTYRHLLNNNNSEMYGSLVVTFGDWLFHLSRRK